MQSLNAQSRALLMQKLDRTGIATRCVYGAMCIVFRCLNIFALIWNLVIFFSIAGSLGGVPLVNGSAPNQQAISMPINGQVAIGPAALPAQVLPSPAYESVGQPSECLLLKNMFDPATEVCDIPILSNFLMNKALISI